MPRHTHLHTIPTIGAGPIVTGQARGFDHSGAQPCNALPVT